MTTGQEVGIVAIGRNEGARFAACLAALPPDVPFVYVDSGSTDGSQARARENGASVVELDMRQPFTAARARNAGFGKLIEDHPAIRFVQFLDGDCALAPGWIERGLEALGRDDRLAIAFGRRRERHPQASLYNAQCDREWNVPPGEVRACGGDALIRVTALREVGGYDDGIIAGEEPDMCLRMRRLGWRICRIDAEMTLHDAAIHSFGAWWRRTRRAGHAYAEHVWRHRGGADPDWVKALLRIVLWGGLMPVGALAGLAAALADRRTLILPFAILLVYLLRYVRLAARARRAGEPWRYALGSAGLLVLDKFAQFGGALTFLGSRMSRRAPRIIEYK